MFTAWHQGLTIYGKQSKTADGVKVKISGRSCSNPLNQSTSLDSFLKWSSRWSPQLRLHRHTVATATLSGQQEHLFWSQEQVCIWTICGEISHIRNLIEAILRTNSTELSTSVGNIMEFVQNSSSMNYGAQVFMMFNGLGKYCKTS